MKPARPNVGALAAAASCALAMACSKGDQASGPDAATEADANLATGPYDGVELTRALEGGVAEPVHVVRDEFGIPHIRAESLPDLAFVQGYVTAHDRLPQMDLLRRIGAGTLAELYGEQALDQDLAMRMHRMKPLAEAAFAELLDSSDPQDAAMVEMLERYAEGVNAYADALAAGEYAVHPSIGEMWDPERFSPWTPVDSLVLGRFMAFGLSYTAPQQIEISEIVETALATFDDATASDAAAARAGAYADLVRGRPIGRVPTVDGFPGFDDAAAATAPKTAAAAPRVARELLRRAARTLSPELPGPVNTELFRHPYAGSNAWTVGPSLTGGEAFLAGDQHLQLVNPSIFYPSHLVIPGELDVQGVSFPGAPGIVLGHNGDIAWSSTVSVYDVNDVYLETVVSCADGEGDCVVFDGGEVPLETFTETVRVGVLGTILDTREATYELVPHHGPIIPTVEDGQIVAREDSEALSVRYTGYEVTHELRAFFGLMFASSVDEAFTAIERFQYGGQNFLIIDHAGNIGWSTHADLPLRAPGALTFHPTENPLGRAPWFVLPGDGSAEWEGLLPAEVIPRAKNPAQGYLVSANSDPVGVTFDGNPLNGPTFEDRPLYLSGIYLNGLRTARIDTLLRERIDAGEPLTLADMAAIQHDTQSTFGERMKPYMDAAFSVFDTGDRPNDVEAFLASLPPERTSAMREAADIVADWSLATPPALGESVPEKVVTDSVATTLFNAWMHFFIDRTIGDEFQAMGYEGPFEVSEEVVTRIVVALYEEPETFASGLAAATDQPVLCDDMATTAVVESCDRMALEALDLAVRWAASEEGFGTDEMRAWRWGKRHTLTIEPLVPSQELTLGPFARAGEADVVNTSPNSFLDLSMRQQPFGPAQRFLAVARPGEGIRAQMQLPGGAIYDPDSRHYRDLLDDYFLPERHVSFPFTTEEIVAAGTERWLVTP